MKAGPKFMDFPSFCPYGGQGVPAVRVGYAPALSTCGYSLSLLFLFNQETLQNSALSELFVPPTTNILGEWPHTIYGAVTLSGPVIYRCGVFYLIENLLWGERLLQVRINWIPSLRSYVYSNQIAGARGRCFIRFDFRL